MSLLTFDVNWFMSLRPGDLITNDHGTNRYPQGPVLVLESPKATIIPGTGSFAGFQGVGLYPDGLCGKITWYSGFGSAAQWTPFVLTEEKK